MSRADRRGDPCADGRLPLLVLGTSLLAPEIADLATDAGFEVAGFVENRERSKCESDFHGLPVHWIDDCAALSSTHVVICGLGTTTRSKFIEQAAASGFCFATVIHPTAHVSRTSTIGEGSIVGVHVAVGSNTQIGRHVFLNRGCTRRPRHANRRPRLGAARKRTSRARASSAAPCTSRWERP